MSTHKEVIYAEDFESYEIGRQFQSGKLYTTPSGLMLNLRERGSPGFFPANMRIVESDQGKCLSVRSGRPDAQQLPNGDQNRLEVYFPDAFNPERTIRRLWLTLRSSAEPMPSYSLSMRYLDFPGQGVGQRANVSSEWRTFGYNIDEYWHENVIGFDFTGPLPPMGEAAPYIEIKRIEWLRDEPLG